MIQATNGDTNSVKFLNTKLVFETVKKQVHGGNSFVLDLSLNHYH